MKLDNKSMWMEGFRVEEFGVRFLPTVPIL